MRPEWEHLRHETAATQVSFLETEAATGITLARIALKAKKPEKISRNLAAARKAYDTITSHLADLPPKTPGLEGIYQKMATLKEMLDSLRDGS